MAIASTGWHDQTWTSLYLIFQNLLGPGQVRILASCLQSPGKQQALGNQGCCKQRRLSVLWNIMLSTVQQGLGDALCVLRPCSYIFTLPL